MYNIGLHHLTGPSSTVAVVAVESRSSATAKKRGESPQIPDPLSAIKTEICSKNMRFFW